MAGDVTTKLDVIAQAQAERTGDSVATTRAYLLAQSQAFVDLDAEELTPAEAKEMLAATRLALDKWEHFAKTDPRGFEAEMMAKSGATAKDIVRREADLASFRMREYVSANPVPAVQFSRETMRTVGTHMWPESFRTVSDQDVHGAYSAMYRAAEARRDQRQVMSLRTEEGAMLHLLCARWAHYGFPAVQVGHKYAAALMSTGVAPGEISPPWETFVIDLPTGMLHTNDPRTGEKKPLVLLVVARWPSQSPVNPTEMWGEHKVDGRLVWSVMAVTACGIELHRHRQPIEQMRQKGTEDPLTGAFDIALTDGDDRTLLLLTRLALNVCVAMSDPDAVKPVGRHGSAVGSVGGRASEPMSRVFSVGRPVEIDCRQEVAEYLSGAKRGPLTVQFMVRGHWRHQAHGPKMTERRLMWIQPHWKGAEHGPIVVRPHIIGTGGQTGEA